MLTQSLVGESIELSGHDVLLKLAVPDLPIIRKKPSAECREFLGGKILYLALKILDVAHGDAFQQAERSIALPENPRLTLASDTRGSEQERGRCLLDRSPGPLMLDIGTTPLLSSPMRFTQDLLERSIVRGLLK